MFDESKVKIEIPSDLTPAYIAAEALTNGQIPKMPKYSKDKNFFEEYWKLYLQNDQLIQKLIKESEERN